MLIAMHSLSDEAVSQTIDQARLGMPVLLLFNTRALALGTINSPQSAQASVFSAAPEIVQAIEVNTE